MGQFLNTANLKQNLHKINEWAGFSLVTFKVSRGVDYVELASALNKISTKWFIEDKIRASHNLPV
jgi:hypothetical protein